MKLVRQKEVKKVKTGKRKKKVIYEDVFEEQTVDSIYVELEGKSQLAEQLRQFLDDSDCELIIKHKQLILCDAADNSDFTPVLNWLLNPKRDSLSIPEPIEKETEFESHGVVLKKNMVLKVNEVISLNLKKDDVLLDRVSGDIDVDCKCFDIELEEIKRGNEGWDVANYDVVITAEYADPIDEDCNKIDNSGCYRWEGDEEIIFNKHTVEIGCRTFRLKTLRAMKKLIDDYNKSLS